MTEQFEYAGFWPRLGAMLLDFLVLIPLLVVILWGQHHYRLFDVYYLLPRILIGLIFGVYLVQRFGGTPGKRMLGLRILRLNGETAGFKRAFVRYLPNFILDSIAAFAIAIPLLHISDHTYFALAAHHRYTNLEALAPARYRWVKLAFQIWVWSELLVLLTNKRRRALHDFIAGTIVVREPPNNSFKPNLLRSTNMA